MRRTKEDMLKTRETILSVALDCFLEKGFEATSLVEVASKANVTRGAIYWHFENKQDLYRAVVDYTIEKGDISKYFDELPADLSFEERLNTVFWGALGENRYVDYVFRTMSYTYGRPEFRDIYDKLVLIKRSLYDALKLEIGVYARTNGLNDVNINKLAEMAYLFFEGTFLNKNIPIGIVISRGDIEDFTKDLVVKMHR